MTVEYIAGLLDKHWHLAVVVPAEDRALEPARRMPPDWYNSGQDVLARYRVNGEMRFPMLRAVEDEERIRELLST